MTPTKFSSARSLSSSPSPSLDYGWRPSGPPTRPSTATHMNKYIARRHKAASIILFAREREKALDFESNAPRLAVVQILPSARLTASASQR